MSARIVCGSGLAEDADCRLVEVDLREMKGWRPVQSEDTWRMVLERQPNFEEGSTSDGSGCFLWIVGKYPVWDIQFSTRTLRHRILSYQIGARFENLSNQPRIIAGLSTGMASDSQALDFKPQRRDQLRPIPIGVHVGWRMAAVLTV